jgi:hypothetical protein
MTSPGVKSGRRRVAWDAVLAFALVAVAALLAAGSVGLAAPAEPGVRMQAMTFVAILIFVVGGTLGISILQGVLSRGVHSRAWVTLSAATGNAGALVAAMTLAPWSGLLSDEVLHGGPVRFTLEAVKTLAPWCLGALVAFVTLRYDPVDAGNEVSDEAAEQGDEADEL